ncbi:D-alpha-D-heptose-7-phosphate kinase [Frigoribacterium faeni]|uniref:GHMP family kinase ATP-binding protein n=1 Tax=Frigoribacterium faeni TaxID=145483 RepID=UPI00141BA671|nr:D-alpha-D-heptose-7-phosphate kinase [Frigoribacterium faeni]NIJ04963.1 D-glycero-alpha-D-manno-heptose-7-phosphate kinase [Frigoribacterium faeni]
MTTFRSRAPLRLGLGGGGTDVSPYSETHGGRILNATIDRFAYASVEPGAAGDDVLFDSPDRQCTGRAAPGDVRSLADDFALHVAVYERVMTDLNGGERVPLRLSTQVDAPPGSGLGSSSALVVAMTQALGDVVGASLDPYALARLAWQVEREDLGLAGGWQDHFAATFGGFNYMETTDGGRVVVNPLRVRREVRSELEASMLLYFGGVSRDSAAVIAEQQGAVTRGDEEALDATHAIRRESLLMKEHLLTGDVPAFAECIRQGWSAKKKLARSITNPAIEHAHEVASRSGMIAGKMSGAGGGGFMMLFVDPLRRLEVARALEDVCGGTVATCHFTDHGVESWRAPGRAA